MYLRYNINVFNNWSTLQRWRIKNQLSLVIIKASSKPPRLRALSNPDTELSWPSARLARPGGLPWSCKPWSFIHKSQSETDKTSVASEFCCLWYLTTVSMYQVDTWTKTPCKKLIKSLSKTACCSLRGYRTTTSLFLILFGIADHLPVPF